MTLENIEFRFTSKQLKKQPLSINATAVVLIFGIS